MASPRPDPAFARHALERLEQMRAGLAPARPGPVSATSMTVTAPSRRAATRDLAVGLAFALQRLHRVAAKIGQHAIELVAVGIDLEPRLDLDDPGDRAAAAGRGCRRPRSTSGGKREALPPRRRLLRLAVIERARAQPDGAVERGDQLRHEALHRRVLDRDQAVGEKLRARQHVAQIVADLAHREAERREPRSSARGSRRAPSAWRRARARRCRSRRGGRKAR